MTKIYTKYSNGNINKTPKLLLILLIASFIILCIVTIMEISNTSSIITGIIFLLICIITLIKKAISTFIAKKLKIKNPNYDPELEYYKELTKINGKTPKEYEEWDSVSKTFTDQGIETIYKKGNTTERTFEDMTTNEDERKNKDTLITTTNLNSEFKDVRKIIICPNCGSKNITKANNSRCQYCDAYIE